MSKPTEIVEAKLLLAMTSAASALRGSVEAIHRREAARGIGGGSIVEVKNECLATMKRFEGAATQELSSVLNQTILANPTTVDQCNAIARRAIDALLEECVAILRKTVTLCGGNARQLEATEPELHSQRDQSLMSVSLALDSRYNKLKLRLLRSIFGFIQRFALLVLRHGT